VNENTCGVKLTMVASGSNYEEKNKYRFAVKTPLASTRRIPRAQRRWQDHSENERKRRTPTQGISANETHNKHKSTKAANPSSTANHSQSSFYEYRISTLQDSYMYRDKSVTSDVFFGKRYVRWIVES
jgi:hypothetical protein